MAERELVQDKKFLFLFNNLGVFAAGYPLCHPHQNGGLYRK